MNNTGFNFWQWLRGSFEDSPGHASGKAISAFVLVAIWVLSVIIAIIFSENHILPDWMGYTNASLIGALYGIKLVGKMFGTNTGSDDPSKP